AEELDLEFDQVVMVPADTFVCTDGFTAASMTVAIGGTKLRAAAAEARRVLLGLASDRLKAPAEDLIVAKGVVSVRSDPQRSVTYGALLGDKRFNLKVMWQPFAPQLPGHEGLFDSYRAAKSIDVVAANTGNVASALTHDGV